MDNAEINYLSSQSVCKFFSINNSKLDEFFIMYSRNKQRLMNKIENALEKNTKNAFRKMEYISTDNKIAKVRGKLENFQKAESHKLKVKSFKSGQVSESSIFNKDMLNKVLEMEQKVELIVKMIDRKVNIKLKFDEGTDYLTILNKIISEINELKLGISVSIVTKKDKKSTMYVLARGYEGSKYAFDISLKATDEIKKLLSFTTKEVAKDTVYELDGNTYSTVLDIIQLNKNVKIELKSEGLVYIKNVIAVGEVIKELEYILNSYNLFIDCLIQNKDIKIVSKELKRFPEALLSLVYELSTIGLEVNLTGKISCDKKKLKKALMEDLKNVKSVIIKKGGLADRIIAVLNDLRINRDTLNSKSKSKFVIKNFDVTGT